MKEYEINGKDQEKLQYTPEVLLSYVSQESEHHHIDMDGRQTFESLLWRSPSYSTTRIVPLDSWELPTLAAMMIYCMQRRRN